MALNKRKVLDAARKFAQKGAKAKALKEYEKLLKADPRDAKLLLEVGDAYRRWGQTEDAIAQYSKVAAQYRQDGFDARAVAVFKQILNLDPKQYSAFVSLSELYQRMGLDSEAAAALQMAADGYHQEGRKTEALELLRQMGALDPTNTTSRTKVAELLRQEGMHEDALAEYEAIAAELSNQQDRDQLIAIQERILEISANHVPTLCSLARTLIAAGDLARAETYATRAAAAAPEPPQFELLMDLYAQQGNDEGLANATRGLAKIYRERGDEDKARELMQRLSVEDVVPSGAGRLAVDLSEVEEPDLGDHELLEDEPFLTLDDDDNGMSSSSSRPSLDFGDVSLETSAPPSAPEAVAAPPPEGDPDQLLAEASVYLRYGKREQALTSLRTVLAIDERHLGALEKLGEWHSDGAENSEAVRVWMQAADVARETNDPETLERIRERIAALDPGMAASIGAAGESSLDGAGDSIPSISGVGADASDAASPGSDLEFDLDLDLDDAMDAVADSVTENGAVRATGGAADDTSTTFEIDLDDDSIVFDEPPSTDVDSAEHTQQGIEFTDSAGDANEDDSIDFEIDVDDFDTADDDVDVAEAGTVTEPFAEAAATPAMSEAQVEEELEEAEFYIAQDMFEEAEAIVSRVLEAIPGHAAALVMSGEIAAGRGVAAEEGDDSTTDADSSPLLDAVTQPDGIDGAEITFDLDSEDEEDDGDVDVESAGVSLEASAPEVVSEQPDDEEVAFELDLDSEEGDDDESDARPELVADHDLADSFVDEPPAAEPAEDPEKLESFEEMSLDLEDEPEEAPEQAPATVGGAADSDPDESFDLREALADVLEEDGAGSTSPSIVPESDGVLSTVEDGFGSIFSDFKKGVTATLDAGDFDTRYDLGIAYREMGLFDDAIGEFRMCLESPDRQFDSLYLMGLCARDLQRWDDAINHLEQALALPEIPVERLAGVYFDLSVAHEGAGDLARAAGTLNQVLELEPEFPGAVERLRMLESGAPSMPEIASPGEVYESFDDLFDQDESDEAGDAALAEATPVETYESFDDVMDASEESELPEAAEVEPETPDAPGGAGDGAPKKSGRRKISFV